MDCQYDIVETANVSVDYSEDQEHYLPYDTYGAYDYVYGPTGNYYLSVDRKSDWGITMGTGWHTYSEAEISYILGYYDHKWTSVNGISGLMILNSKKVTPSVIEDTYNLSAWQRLEAEGAVFLPTTGLREYDDDNSLGNIVISKVGKTGNYWTSSYDTEDEDADYAICLIYLFQLKTFIFKTTINPTL